MFAKQFFLCSALLLSCAIANAEVATFYVPSRKGELQNMKSGVVTVAITQGSGSSAPGVNEDYIMFYPENDMTITVADGYVINKVTMGTTDKVFMEPVKVSTGEFLEVVDFVWTPDSVHCTSTMTLTNGVDDTTGKGYKFTEISAISVYYSKPNAEQMTPEITDENVSMLSGGGIQIEVQLLSSDYELYYKVGNPSRADGDHDGFTLAEGTGKVRAINLSSPGRLAYYVYDPSSQTKGIQRVTTINGDGTTTGIAYLRLTAHSDAAGGCVYDMQGRCATHVRRPGLYLINGRKHLLR